MSKQDTATPETLATWYELKPQRLVNESLHTLCFANDTLNFEQHQAIEFSVHAPAHGGSRQGRTVTTCARAIPYRGATPTQQHVPENSPLVSAARNTDDNAHPATEFLDKPEPIEAARMLAPETVASPPARLSLPEGYTSYTAYHDTSAISAAVQKLRHVQAEVYLQVCLLSMDVQEVPNREANYSIDDESAITPTKPQHTYAVGVTVSVRTTTDDGDAGNIAEQILTTFGTENKQLSLVSLPVTPDRAANRVQEPRFKPYGTKLLNLFQVFNLAPTRMVGSRLPANSRLRGVPGKVQVCEDDLEWFLGAASPRGNK